MFLNWSALQRELLSESIFFLSFNHVWSFSYFGSLLYIGLIFLAQVYLVANLRDFTTYNTLGKNTNSFTYLTGFDLSKLLITPTLLFCVLNCSWTSPTLLAWFGHLTMTALQYKIFYWLLFWFTLVLFLHLTSIYFTGADVYDYVLVKHFLLFWLLLLFYSTNLFSFIFFIEILSLLILMVLVTSTFSTAYFYNTTGFSNHSYFQQSLPFAYLQTLLFFFWVSLVGSLNLFIFLILFYAKFLTFDWFLLELVFNYLTSINSLKDLYYVSLTWLIFLTCLFLKCGLAPFYFWKPTFFKGISLHALLTYITFFYFFLILYFTYLLTTFLSEIFYFNIFINLVLVFFGMTVLLFLLFESYYIKVFFAISSILNTLLVFLAISSNTTLDLVFFL